ncbi:HEPN/Toprim-associated domain-containing protein [Mucilaginibacter sp. OK098]|uniref:HEPN/Toprim-associated domain-containing protein n=1 Tax=Mucilaginibacter sp. OK098 TaxID=1855297 RepID=UPI0009100F9E|nr:HEPN/Toprim-associated domain-containing protein [Mucilaginibacter sp. OK098]SHM92385.1 hypothetical protein SAMN05216524_104131 [Mucilaginibacter sp. OK098]
MEYEYLSLGVGKLEIEWRKYIFGMDDHFALFQPEDKTDVLYYFDDDEVIKSRTGQGYSKSLGDVRERLNMLGYSYRKLPPMLNEYFRSFSYQQEDFKGFSPKKFVELLSAVDINEIDWVEHEGDADYGEFFSRRILTLPQFEPIKSYLEAFSRSTHYIFEQIDPYIILTALAENPKNRKLLVEWRKKDKFIDLDKYKTYLIVTEGPTDGVVLKKVLQILRPEIADFFDFIDMKENYPFGGVGSMIKFFQGVTKIGTDRQMVFIFDNDTEGRYNFDRLNNVPHPINMKKFVLSDLTEFQKFKTKGDHGDAEEDVNRRAVAIEMYLDHKYLFTHTPFVAWGGIHPSAQTLQGALKSKTKYYDKFMSLEEQDYGSYDFSKLNKLLEHLLADLTS